MKKVIAFIFDLFGIKARRKERESQRLAEAQAARQKYLERKRMIDAYLDDYRKKKSEKEWQAYEVSQKKADEKNATCPMCQSKNVVHKVVRTKGEVHGQGNSNSYSSGGLFSHYASSRSDWRLDGSLDTLPVNKCNDCGHEWNIEKAERPDYFNPFDFRHAQWLYDAVEEYMELEYDPYDKTEPYNSLEEKQTAFIEKESSRSYLECYRQLPRYMLDYVVYLGGKVSSRYEDNAFVVSHDSDEYSYIMPDTIFDIVKRLTKWEGE